MSFTPVVRWRNFTLDNVKAVLGALPDLDSTHLRNEAIEIAEENIGGYKRTVYQFACQLGLECRGEQYKVNNYLYMLSDAYLDKYIEFWFKMYVAPNPYIQSNDAPVSVYLELAQRVMSAPTHIVNFDEYFQEVFGEGQSTDILWNIVKKYGYPLKADVADSTVYVEEADLDNLNRWIEMISASLPMANNKDENEFFERFSYRGFADYVGEDPVIYADAGTDPQEHNPALVLNERLVGKAVNRIIFGAPGTGKSHTIDIERQVFGSNYERVTFHPNYSYAQFVGTYKPVPITLQNGEQTITYSFVPGPFTRSLVKALQNPTQPYLLIIEEINRANAAAVFGDVFQLLDRKNGISEYPIDTGADLRNYFNSTLEQDLEKIVIPANLYIWASMNSADQGVYPMDTAFKRRWSFEYMGINKGEERISRTIILTAGHRVNWNELRKGINELLIQLRVNEDKLLGSFFIDESALDNDELFNKVFKSKVLMYLFEDAAKQRRVDLFTGCNCGTYSSICDAYDEIGERIFGLNLAINDTPAE